MSELILPWSKIGKDKPKIGHRYICKVLVEDEPTNFYTQVIFFYTVEGWNEKKVPGKSKHWSQDSVRYFSELHYEETLDK